jgi:hypothetical protein
MLDMVVGILDRIWRLVRPSIGALGTFVDRCILGIQPRGFRAHGR